MGKATDTDKRKPKPSEEKVWQKHYAANSRELLLEKMPEVTLWKFISTALKKDNDEHDAMVYFGRHIKRSTMLAKVEKWARVMRGMGLGVGDQILLFSPAIPESYYVLFAADSIGVTTIMPNMSASSEALNRYYAQAKVAFVFDGMENLLSHILKKTQFEYVVLMDATRSISAPLKHILGIVNWVKTRKTRNRHTKYFTMRQAIAKFGKYEGPVESPYQADRIAMVFSTGGTTKTGEAKLICMTDKAMVEMFRGAKILNKRDGLLKPGNTSLCQLPPFVCTGLFVLVLLPLAYGLTIYIEPRLNQEKFNACLKKIRPNITLVPGPLWAGFFSYVEQQLAKGKQLDLSHFTFPVMGGEGCTPEKLAWMNELARKCNAKTGIVSGYGMSEVFSVISVDYRPELVEKQISKLAISVGYPYPGFTVGIFDKDGNELGYNQRGELWVNTPTRLAGYLHNGHLEPYTPENDWIHTGDLCEMDEDGLVYVYGRMSNHIDAPDGTPVYLFDIANHLRQDKDVKESLVTTIDNDLSQNPHITAHLVLENGAQMDYDLLKRLDDNMATMLPKGVEVSGYKQQEEFKMSFICKTDSYHYGTERDGYLKPSGGQLVEVVF